MVQGHAAREQAIDVEQGVLGIGSLDGKAWTQSMYSHIIYAASWREE